MNHSDFIINRFFLKFIAHISWLRYFSLFILLIAHLQIFSQKTPKNITQKHKRLIYFSAFQVSAYSASMIALKQIWYADYPKSSFHFFNDAGQWLQMDKIGHGFSSYYMTYAGYYGFLWTGLSPKKSTFIASGLSFLYVSSIEIFDGFSAQWGASPPDLLANFTGISLFLLQELIWQEQRIVPKFSFHSTKYSAYRPDLLGRTFSEKLMKDYNGQTYWLSIRLNSFFEKKIIPRWLCFSVGYGATGMLGGHSNPDSYNNQKLPKYERKRQFYASVDVDFNSIKYKSKYLKTTGRIINLLKVPLPTFELTKQNLKVKPIYF